MKKGFILLLLISFAMICSCQKQDSAVEQQLAQRKAELDAREKELDEREKASGEREKALTEREKALAENEKSTTNAGAIPPDVESQSVSRDPTQLKAERDKIIQQISAEIRPLVPDDSKMRAQRERENKSEALKNSLRWKSCRGKSSVCWKCLAREYHLRWRVLRQLHRLGGSNSEALATAPAETRWRFFALAGKLMRISQGYR
jgi:hypothetical protein